MTHEVFQVLFSCCVEHASTGVLNYSEVTDLASSSILVLPSLNNRQKSATFVVAVDTMCKDYVWPDDIESDKVNHTI